MSYENLNHLGKERQRQTTGSRRRFLFGGLTGFLPGGLIVGAISLYSHAKLSGEGPAFPGLGHFGRIRHSGLDPDLALERADFATEWFLKRVNATDEQRQKITSIV